MNRLRVSILQTDIAWENKQDNLRRLREKLETLRGAAEIVVLPETFSTGFSMNTDKLAEPVTGDTITTLRQWASEYRIAIAGSYISCEENSVSSEDNSLSREHPAYYNRRLFPHSRRRSLFLRQAALVPHGQRNGTFHGGQSPYRNPLPGLEHTVACLLRPSFPDMEQECKQRIRPVDLRRQLACTPAKSLGRSFASACAGEHKLRLRRKPVSVKTVIDSLTTAAA